MIGIFGKQRIVIGMLRISVVVAMTAIPIMAAGKADSQPAGSDLWSIRFQHLDRNADGVLTPEEFGKKSLFQRLDSNKDGKLTLEEIRKGVRRAAGHGRIAGLGLPVPTRKDVHYGPHQRNALDFWQARSDKPMPLIVFIHGGGFVTGDKADIPPKSLRRALDAGVSVASISYRFLPQAPVQDILRDCARAIQYIRFHADEFRIDSNRIAAFGNSAGAGTSLWLAVHDDLADPNAGDPVLRQTSRIAAAGCFNGQATYDLIRWEEIVYPIRKQWWQRESEVRDFYHFDSDDELRAENGRKVRADCSMYDLLSPDDPPFMMVCNYPGGDPTGRGHVLHHPKHAEVIKQRADQLGVKAEICIKQPRGKSDTEKKDNNAKDDEEETQLLHIILVDFLLKQLGVPLPPTPSSPTTMSIGSN